jgi:hypothetical protein
MKRSDGIRVANLFPSDWANFIDPNFPRLGMGFDVATSLKVAGGGGKKTVSNPSAICLDQQIGLQCITRLILRFRTNDPAVAIAIIDVILAGIPEGMRVGKLCIDASNERFFAVNVKSHLAGRVTVIPVISGEKTTYGSVPMNFKQYLGSQLVDMLEDGYSPLPEAEWLRKDMRLVKKVGDTFDTELDEDGNHGDTFDAKKLAVHALVGKGGPAQASGAKVGTYGGRAGAGTRKFRNPYASKFESKPRRAI